jgi:regulatory subunit for Cdc7p protein kinase
VQTCEKYFSSKVTHLVTNRTTPNEPVQQSTTASTRLNSRSTVNPALIDQRADARKVGKADILLKAKEYGMKIWAIEKLDRVLNVLFEFNPNRPSLTAIHHPRQAGQTYTNTQPQNNDLSHLLKQERLHGPTDRDPTVDSKELHFWKGPYIYIQDSQGTHRPIIVREYPKVQHREDGTWPQFRSVSGGRCPFIDEQAHQAREQDRVAAREEKAEKAERAERAVVEKERPRAVPEAKIQAPPARTAEQRQRTVQSVKEATVSKERSPAKPSPSKPKTYLGRSKRVLAELGSTNSTRAPVRNAIAFTATNETASQTTRRSNIEPAASGVQPSNVTSAIRSQMVSSHQDQPGHRAGTSKEIHALHRKVAGNVLMSNPSISRQTSMARRSTDLLARAAENEAKATRQKQAATKVEEKRRPKPEPKPGYCENCREKFDDFEEVSFFL